MDRVTVLRKGDPEIPRRLTEIRDAPEILYCDGDVSLLRSRCVAIVGSRKCTQYGISVARAIARRCAECGLTVVSGMALGIDAAAHQGALEAGGRTIAVFACGPDVCYPRENRRIMKEIRDRGLIFSEYPPGEKPAPYKFPMRNRIISGISEAVVVVEASYRSGVLFTGESPISQQSGVRKSVETAEARAFSASTILDVWRELLQDQGKSKNREMRWGENERRYVRNI